MSQDTLLELFKLVRRWRMAGLISDEGYAAFIDLWSELYEQQVNQKEI